MYPWNYISISCIPITFSSNIPYPANFFRLRISRIPKTPNRASKEATFTITPNFILRQQDTKQGQSSVKFCSGDRVYWQLRASVITTCCDFHLRVFSPQWVLGRFVYNGFKILKNFHNMNLHISLLFPSKSSVLRDYCCSLPATKRSTTE